MSYVMLWYRKGPANYVGSLMDYVARGYSPALGRFVSADTIVPGAGNSQAYNRYMYVRGNPLGRIDPSGHQDCSKMSGDPFWQCRYNNAHGVQWNDTTLKWDLIDAVFMDTDILNQVAQEAGVIWGTGEFGIRKWQSDEKSSVMQGIVRLANKVGGFARFATLRGNQTVDFIRTVSFGPLAPGTPASTRPAW